MKEDIRSPVTPAKPIPARPPLENHVDRNHATTQICVNFEDLISTDRCIPPTQSTDTIKIHTNHLDGLSYEAKEKSETEQVSCSSRTESEAQIDENTERGDGSGDHLINFTPPQKEKKRPKLKKHKHMPKVLDESKQKKTPKAKKPTSTRDSQTTSKRTKKGDTAKPSRKRKNRSKIVPDSLEDVVHENANKPCKRSLDFSLEDMSMLEDNNDQTASLISSEKSSTLVQNLDLGNKDSKLFGYQYQRRKKRTNSQNYVQTACTLLPDTEAPCCTNEPLLVHQRLFKQNQCVEKSRKIGPNFVTKKGRARRVKAMFYKAWRSSISSQGKVILLPPSRKLDLIGVKKSDPKSIECVTTSKRQNKPRSSPSLNTKQFRFVLQELERLSLSEKYGQLVVHKQNGEQGIVPYEGEFSPLKKRKPPPKIVLNPETQRVFYLLMTNGGSSIKDEEAEADPKKKEYWERERRIMEQKVDIFIDTMSRYQGDRAFSPWGGSVVDSVVGAFLTQNTNDRLSSSAFMCLAARYPVKKSSRQDNYQIDENFVRMKTKAEQKNEIVIDWESLRKKYSSEKERSEKTLDAVDWDAVRRASLDEVANIIKERGQNNIIARKIQNFLGRLVQEHRSIDLEWLRDVPPKDAKDFLLSIYGIGLKSAECIRLLTLGHVAFPVDVNVGRVAVRLGWVPLQPLPESLQLHLLEKYPIQDSIQQYLYPRLCHLDSKKLYLLHVHSIAFGKFFCTKINPNCNVCPMRGGCKHFASVFASARLPLPAPESANKDGSNSSAVTQSQIVTSASNPGSQRQDQCNPIVEIPASPEPEFEIEDIEDLLKEPHGLHESDDDNDNDNDNDYEDEDDEEIPTIRLDNEALRQTILEYLEKNRNELDSGETSKALALLKSVATSPTMTLKQVQRLRTVHQVYELPDSHPILEGVEKKDPDEQIPCLFAVWEEGVESCKSGNSYSEATGNSSKPTEQNVCREIVCSSRSNFEEHESTLVYGTLMIGVRSANRGKFPLNGTYFQVNEIFADHESTQRPIAVPRSLICGLPKRLVYCGAAATSIFKGLPLEQLEHACWRGFMCIRSFNRTTRYPSELDSRFHVKYGMQGKKKAA